MRINIKILIPLIFLLIVFEAAAQKYQLRPVVVQVLPLGLDMTSKFGSNESGITDGSQISDYVQQRGGKFTTNTFGLNMNLSVYVPVYKNIYAGFTYNMTNSKSDLVRNTDDERMNETEEFNKNIHLGNNKFEYVTFTSNYERKISTAGIGLMYLPVNPMRGLPFIPYIKLGVNLVNVSFSDAEITKRTSLDNVIQSETTPALINDFSSLSFNGALGLNIKINSTIQYTLFEANIAQFKMSTDNISLFSVKTGVTILIGKRK